MPETDDQEGLLRVVTLSSVPTGDERPVFPGAELFQPVEQLNERLVAALVHRRVELTARNERGACCGGEERGGGDCDAAGACRG